MTLRHLTQPCTLLQVRFELMIPELHEMPLTGLQYGSYKMTFVHDKPEIAGRP